MFLIVEMQKRMLREKRKVKLKKSPLHKRWGKTLKLEDYDDKRTNDG